MATNTKAVNNDDKVKILGEEEATVKSFLSLEDVLGLDTEKLTALAMGTYETERLGTVAFTAIDHTEYKQAKKDCVSINVGNDGNVQTSIDDDKLMVKIIILAVDKDTRSNFTFASKALLEKLNVRTADAAVGSLLSPGEIVNFAVAIQNASGFGAKKQKQDADVIKNS